MPDLRAQWDAKKAHDTQEAAPPIRSETAPKSQSRLQWLSQPQSQSQSQSQDRNLAQSTPSWWKGGPEILDIEAKLGGSKFEGKRPDGPTAKSTRRHVPLRPASNEPPQATAPTKAPIQTKWVEPKVDHRTRTKNRSGGEKSPVMTTHEYLRDVSADILSLNIGSGIARSIQRHSAGPVVEAANGKLAILGLDFGTAFTKAVVQWGRLHYAVDWSPVVLGEDPYLLASVFSEHLDGECVLGAFEGEDWAVRDGIKMRLLAASSGSAEVDLTDAVIFLSLAFRHANRWLRQTRGASNDEIRWRLHVGLPAQSWDDRGITTSFKSVAHAARLAASAPGKVTRRSASKALAMAHLVKQPAVDVFPEFACQLYSYLGSSERQDDLHALVDIGAGTIDVAFFNVFVRDGERLLPIFSAGVEKLGAHYMIAALAGQRGVEVDWHDRESSMSDAEIAQKIGDTIESVAKRRSLFLSAVADLFNANRQRARDVYETSPAFKGLATVRLFICGGGSRISAFRKHFHRIQAESATLLRLNFLVSDLVRPQNIVGNFGVNFDRLSVAYGLSQLGINIGNVMRSADLKPLRASVAEGSKHRDDDR